MKSRIHRNAWLIAATTVALATLLFAPRDIGGGEQLGYGRAFLFGLLLVGTYAGKVAIDRHSTRWWVHVLTTFGWTFAVSATVFFGSFVSARAGSMLLGSAVFALVLTAVISFVPLMVRFVTFTRR